MPVDLIHHKSDNAPLSSHIPSTCVALCTLHAFSSDVTVASQLHTSAAASTQLSIRMRGGRALTRRCGFSVYLVRREECLGQHRTAPQSHTRGATSTAVYGFTEYSLFSTQQCDSCTVEADGLTGGIRRLRPILLNQLTRVEWGEANSEGKMLLSKHALTASEDRPSHTALHALHSAVRTNSTRRILDMLEE
jgi:hypothetical protein